MRWHCWFLGEDVHGLGTFLVIPTKNSELQSISPPSLEAASCSTGTAVINCSTGTAVMTVLQDQQLNSSWTAELLKSRTLVGSLFYISIEVVAFDRLLKLSQIGRAHV